MRTWVKESGDPKAVRYLHPKPPQLVEGQRKAFEKIGVPERVTYFVKPDQ